MYFFIYFLCALFYVQCFEIIIILVLFQFLLFHFRPVGGGFGGESEGIWMEKLFMSLLPRSWTSDLLRWQPFWFNFNKTSVALLFKSIQRLSAKILLQKMLQTGKESRPRHFKSTHKYSKLPSTNLRSKAILCRYCNSDREVMKLENGKSNGKNS